MTGTGNPFRRPSDLAREMRGSQPDATSRSGGGGSWPPGFASGTENRLALLVLLGLATVTPRRLLALAASHPSAAACLQAVRGGISASVADAARARTADGESIRRSVEACGARLVAVGDAEYPAPLAELVDPPVGLFVLGRDLAEAVAGRSGSPAAVAVVGARNCSPGGAEIATGLARGVSRAGVCVVSGGARGIDAAAHRGALEAPGGTVAVLGSGIDVPYPRSSRALLRAVAAAGTLVSEYPPGTQAEPFRFPARNRLVAGLSRAVVVIEGVAGSGSMITADHALETGRDVFAVPGAVTSELAEAPLALIRDGAGLVRGPEDLLHDLGLDPGEGSVAPGSRQYPEGLSGDGAAVWRALGSPAALDAVSALSGLSPGRALAALGELELRDLVRAIGGRYERTWRGGIR